MKLGSWDRIDPYIRVKLIIISYVKLFLSFNDLTYPNYEIKNYFIVDFFELFGRYF